MADEKQLTLKDIADWPLNEVNAFVVLGKGQSWESRTRLTRIDANRRGGGYAINNDPTLGIYTGLEPVEIGYSNEKRED